MSGLLVEIQDDGDPVCSRCTSEVLKAGDISHWAETGIPVSDDYQQRMMADYHAAANDLTHIKIVLDSFGLLAPNHLKLYPTFVSSEV